MEAFWIMLKNVVLFVALAVPGFLMVKRGGLKQEQSAAFSKLLMNVGMPFLIISGVINSVSISGNLLWYVAVTLAVGILYTLLLFLLSAPLSRGEKNEKTRGMLRFCSVFSNNGFLGIPLAMSVFGADSPVMTVLILLNIVTNILMQTLGVYLVSGDKSKIRLKGALFNPVVIALFVGVALNLAHVKDFIPEVAKYSTHFSNLVTPVSMVILGMKLGAVRISSLFSSKKMYYAAFLKLLIFPAAITALLLAVHRLFPSGIVDSPMVLGTFFAFSMPTAGLASTFADAFSGDTENAVSMTLGTTVLSIVTIPLLYSVTCMFLG